MTVLAAFTLRDMESLIYPERAEFGRGKDKQKRKSRFALNANQKRRLESVPRIGQRFKAERQAGERQSNNDRKNRLYGNIAKGAGALGAAGLVGTAAMRYGGAGAKAFGRSQQYIDGNLGNSIKNGFTDAGRKIGSDASRAAGAVGNRAGQALSAIGNNKLKTLAALGLAGGAALGATRTKQGKRATSYAGRKAGQAGRLGRRALGYQD